MVMPVYNALPYLNEAIESVLAQTFTDFELLAADNGSTDNSVAVVLSYGDPRIRFFRNERNLGIFGSLNRLCREARAPLIKIFCADDVMQPECLAQQVGFMSARPDLGFSRCHDIGPAYAGARPPLCYQPQLPEIIYPEASALAFFTFGNIPGNLTNLIMRTDAYRSVGEFNPQLPYAGDMEMWVRMAASFPFGIQKDRLVRIREHPRQASFLLNQRSELLPQADVVYSQCFSRLSAKHHKSIRWGFALYHGDYWVRSWVKRLLSLRWQGLGLLFRRRSFSVGVWWWFLCSGLRLNKHVGQRYVEDCLGQILATNELITGANVSQQKIV